MNIVNESYDLDVAIDKIDGELGVISIHLIKCWYIDDDELHHHWSNELRGHLYNIVKYAYNVKIKKGRISEKKFRAEFSNISNLRMIKLCFEALEDEYKIVISDDILKETKRRMSIFFDEMFRTLGKGIYDIDKMMKLMEVLRG